MARLGSFNYNAVSPSYFRTMGTRVLRGRAIDARDIAAVAAEALLQPEAHAGQRYVLTGGEAVGYEALADALSDELGTTITYRSLSMDEMRERMRGQGVSEKMIDSMLALASYQKAGGPTERVSESVRNILDRPPRTIRDFVRDHKNEFIPLT